MPIFDVKADDIRQLTDVDLRELVGRLCDSEAHEIGVPNSAVRYGGHQNAADGGLDVEVKHNGGLNGANFIPRSHTGYQVKKHSMAKAKINEEMKPNAKLRPIIQQLSKNGGAYIIVSGRDDCSSGMLDNRLSAMREAVAGIAGHNDLKVDFYDVSRVAKWANLHEPTLIWLREKLGRPITGWRPYGNWSNSPESSQTYITDEEVRLFEDRSSNEGMDALSGIESIRDRLRHPQTAIRLAGLSGTGKTRLVQALFDSEVGQKCLSSSLAIYTDVGDEPSPSAREMVERLVAERKGAIVVVDNCPPETHTQLVPLVRGSNSKLSLITVEFDVIDGSHEETNAFRLQPNSDELITKLVTKSFPAISTTNVETIVKYSGGNARIAKIIANTVESGDTISGFDDATIFQRLFKQRRPDDPNLMQATEVLSIVYSFECESTIGDQSELHVLGTLVGQSAVDLYRAASELLQRQLAQKRGKWRAVLPQALADKVAKQALKKIPLDQIKSAVLRPHNERLLSSFCNRLGSLHDSNEAVAIVNEWLAPGELLGNLNELDDDKFALLEKLGPVAPEKVLNCFERAISNNPTGSTFKEHTYFAADAYSLVRNIAYEPELFERSVKVLVHLSIEFKGDHFGRTARDSLRKLFQIYLSGTMASANDRHKAIQILLSDNKKEVWDLGFDLIAAALNTDHFMGAGQARFGARIRSRGYEPKNWEEIQSWYRQFLDLCVEATNCSNDKKAKCAKDTIAGSFRGLWQNAKLLDELESIAKTFTTSNGWIEGYYAAKETLQFLPDKPDPEEVRRLEKIIDDLAPAKLPDRLRAYLTRNNWQIAEASQEADTNNPYEKIAEEAEKLGAELSSDKKLLSEIMPELICGKSNNLFSIAKGLIKTVENAECLFNFILAEFEKCDDGSRNARALCGLLVGAKLRSDIDLNLWLETLHDRVSLRPHFVELQIAAGIDEAGLNRLFKLLDYKDIETQQFISLGHGRAHEAIDDDRLADLLTELAKMSGGASIAIDILSMRYFGERDLEYVASPAIIVAGLNILMMAFEECAESGSKLDEHDATTILDRSLAEPYISTNEILSLFGAFDRMIAQRPQYFADYGKILKSMARSAPRVFLDCFVENCVSPAHRHNNYFRERGAGGSSALNEIPYSDIHSWCEVDSTLRFSLVAGLISPFTKPDTDPVAAEEDAILVLTNTAISLVEDSPSPPSALERIAQRLRPSSWSGSRARIMERRQRALEYFVNHERGEISNAARQIVGALDSEIRDQRKLEEEWDRRAEQSFE